MNHALLAAGALLLAAPALSAQPKPAAGGNAAAPLTWEGSAEASTQLPGDTPEAVDTRRGDPNLDLSVNPYARRGAPDLSRYRGMGGPEDADAGGYPPCSRTVTDRCIEPARPGN